jgi:outer membrane protein assembly factor BamB
MAEPEPAWGQYQRDLGNSGFALVRTERAERPRWFADVGPALFAGPVIGSDGRIYVSQLDQGLLALDADGNQVWSAALTDIGTTQVMSTPAVDLDNDAYVTVTDYRDMTTRLHRVSAAGQEVWSAPVPQFTTGSPKLWGGSRPGTIFVSARARLFAFSASSGDLLADELLPERCPIRGSGPDIGDWLEKLADIFTEIPFREFPLPSPQVPPPPQTVYPSIAVLDNENIIREGRPVLIVSQPCDVHVLEWSSSTNGITRLGTVRSDDRLNYTSPAISASGLVVVGSTNGDVLGLLVDPSKPPHISLAWRFDAGEPIQFTPAATIRQIFVATSSRLIVLDSNGERLDEFRPPEQITGPQAVSADHVFLGTVGGLYSLKWDLTTQSLDDSIVPWFYRSPAIGEDGSVIVGEREAVAAYPGR